MMCWVALLNMCLPGWLCPSSPWWVLESDHCCLSTQSEWRWPQPPTGPAPSTLLWWSPRPGLCCSSPGWKWAHVQHNTEETLIYWELSFYRLDNIISHSLRISCVLHQYLNVLLCFVKGTLFFGCFFFWRKQITPFSILGRLTMDIKFRGTMRTYSHTNTQIFILNAQHILLFW